MGKVTVAQNAGFCFGVKRAVELVYEKAGQGMDVYTYGPIIHNEEVVADLGKKGVSVIHSLDNIKEGNHGTVIIRSHGVAREVVEALKEKGLTVEDATCPFVKKIHKIVEEQGREGRRIIIIGNDRHPEVEGIKGWCNTPVTVISTEEEAENLRFSKDEKLCIVSQTTFNYKKFKELVEILSKKGYDIIALNTICNATEVRQKESRELARKSDCMLVLGGKESSNTQKLYEICKKECENTYYIQTLADLDLSKVQASRNVGITAGASTPNNIIKEVQIACQNHLNSY